MSETRDRLVAATNELFRRRGYHGTGLKEVTQAASATTGSLYHFFPGGKSELAEAVIAESGAAYRQLFEMIADEATDPAAAVTAFFDGAAHVLGATDFIDVCPIGTVAREVANTNDRLRVACDRVFADWIDAAAIRFARAGLAADESIELATTVIAALEGGFILARTRRDTAILHTIGRHMSTHVRRTLTPTRDRYPRARR
jgi:AcrR family transcriptional regulator